MAGELAPQSWGIPVVPDAATRDALFPLTTRVQDQRVFRKDTLTIERWSGSAWLTDFGGQVVSVRSQGAVGDGTTDDQPAFQAAFNACPAGGIVLIPPHATTGYALKSPVLGTGRDVTVLVQGTILDRINAGWVFNAADLTLTGKGLFAFAGGRIAVIGNGQLTVSGPSGVAGVSQGARNIFYFYNTTSLLVRDVTTVLATDHSVVSYACSDITHCDSNHSGGLTAVMHINANGCVVDNVTAKDGTGGGVVVSNRAAFASGVLAWTRAKNARIVNCKVSNYANPGGVNDAAVGITVDAVDDYVVANNLVDGNGIGTFAYSFADTTRGLVVGNSGKNYNNVHVGSTLPGGIGMECIRVASSVFMGNFFQNVMCGYQIADCTDSLFDGVYENIPAATATFSDSAVSCFAQLANSAGGSDNLRISGVQEGGNFGVVLAAGNHKVYVENLHSRKVFRSFVSGSGGGVAADYLSIKNSSGETNAAASADGINLVAATVTDCDIDGVRLYAPSVGAGFSAISAAGAGRVRIGSKCTITNYESGIDGTNAALAELKVSGAVDFTGVTTRIKNVGSVVSLVVDTPSLSVAGVPVLVNTIPYSASMTPNALNGREWVITATDGVAFAINAPTNKMLEEIVLTIRNASGGARGASTFNAIYKQSGEAVGNSTNGNSTSARFKYDGTNYVQITPWTVNVPN